MLAKILEDMWVEPEVLEALSEEQKRILFLKMREEQVRRWREREEREEREGQINNNTRPKKASTKHVRWLLGRDGDVSVIVIGEVDEFRSSKLLQGLINNRLHSDNMNGIQTADLLPGREAQQLGFKEDIQLPLTDVSDDRASPNAQLSEDEMDSCGADDDLKDPAEDSDSESGGSSDNLSDWAPLYRPHFSSHGNQPPLKAQLSDAERDDPQDRDIVCLEEQKSQYGGRVAQLKKAFADDPHSTRPAYTKPPIPAKPAHLQGRSTPLIH
ncbi:SH2 domain-containing protein 4A isoform X1 [Scomber japonicus]|uniref:SH2 domain-containing protein 4A isoform X1 n=1 Tax=Scomber japonicus TaxID=13676 RepID=UPI002305D88E|nr:SH2 domain-containing protein 4A isoform X1 [Scomber japonicus]XP_053180359.1 SH2 domain-containing protein 4A isoform X1 [Scomber japonicus]XP_053180360.1 SH2 domain-containing protein 4A isoform X1 [Scomber japonicus]